MAITSIKTGSSFTNLVKHENFLAGNAAYQIPNSYESIATVTVGSGGAADVTFSSIPATYTNLQIRGIARSLEANTGVDVPYVQFNSDTGSNYNWHQLDGNGATTSAPGSASTTFMRGGFIGLNSELGSTFGAVIIDILDYANVNKNKTIRVLSGTSYNNTSGAVGLFSGVWRNTNAITTIKLTASVANLAQYSQFALYGIKGA
jgi:hypothetical protein